MPSKHIKVDFHLHTKEDPYDFIDYDSYELVDMMAARGYGAIAITNHNKITYSEKLKDYAKERGLVVIRGVERTVRGRHLLLINFKGHLSDYRSLHDIEKAKRPDNLVIAAHPYFPMPTASGRLLDAHPDIFDALEFCHYYSRNMNFNKKAVICSYNMGKPLVGNSDAHTVRQIGRTCSLVECSTKDPEAIIHAIKEGRVEVVTKPFKARTLIHISSLISLRNFKGRMMCLIKNGKYGYRGEPDADHAG